MKKFILIAALLIGCNSIGYTQTRNSSPIDFGGINTESTVSILQVLDYPVLRTTNKEESVKSYRLNIRTGNAKASFDIQGPKLSQEAINYLRDLHGEKGDILIDQVVLLHEGLSETNDKVQLVLHFNQ